MCHAGRIVSMHQWYYKLVLYDGLPIGEAKKKFCVALLEKI